MPLKETNEANNSNSFYAITKLTSEKYIISIRQRISIHNFKII